MASSFGALQPPPLQIIPYIRPPPAECSAPPTSRVSKNKRPLPATASAPQTSQAAVPGAKHNLNSSSLQALNLQTFETAPSSKAPPQPREPWTTGSSLNRPLVILDDPSDTSLVDNDTDDEVPSIPELVRRHLARLRGDQDLALASSTLGPAPSTKPDDSSTRPVPPPTRATSLPAKRVSARDNHMVPHRRAGSVPRCAGPDAGSSAHTARRGLTPVLTAHGPAAPAAQEITAQSGKPARQDQSLPLEADVIRATSPPPVNAQGRPDDSGSGDGVPAPAARLFCVPEDPEVELEGESASVVTDDEDGAIGVSDSTDALDSDADQQAPRHPSRAQADSAKFAADEDWEVHCIIGKRRRQSAAGETKRPKPGDPDEDQDSAEDEYLVEWAQTWVRRSLLDCPDLLRDYEERSAQVKRDYEKRSAQVKRVKSTAHPVVAQRPASTRQTRSQSRPLVRH